MLKIYFFIDIYKIRYSDNDETVWLRYQVD